MSSVKFVVTVESAASMPRPEVFVGLDQNNDDMVTETELSPARKTEPGRFEATIAASAEASGKVLWRVLVHGAAGSTYTAAVTGSNTVNGSGKVGLSKMGLLGGEVSVG